MKPVYLALAGLFLTTTPVLAEQFSINDALRQAMQTNPGVGEASANRRATQSELRQTQSTLLPQVRIDASYGPEKFDQSPGFIAPNLAVPTTGSGPWRNGSQESVVVRQLLFDGFTSIHEVWRQTARVNAAAARVKERTELIALDAAEAYVDVVRYMRLVSLGEQNVANHDKIFANVNSRFSGGRAGEGDLEQSRERVENARAALAEFRRSLEDARAKYRKVVGLEPYNLRFPGPLRGMPGSRDESLAVALRFNSTITAAQSDADAAKHAFKSTDGLFAPKFYLEGRATHYDNSFPYVSSPGARSVTHEDYSGKVVMSWDIFRGGQDAWNRTEKAERFTEATMRHARLQRDANESIDKAWNARTITQTRISALSNQLQADRKTIAAFQKEYELGQRSLIDLLNAQNQFFNASVSLTSARAVVVFADYQLLAAMGTLIEYLKAPPPVDAAPTDLNLFGLPNYSAPNFRWTLPQTGSEPLHVPVQPPAAAPVRLSAAAPATASQAFSERWSGDTTKTASAAKIVGASEWLAQREPKGSPVVLEGDQRTAYAKETKPHWLLTAFSPQPK
ncbi:MULTISPECIES: TolC family outer membrane protein [Bradyrhizobium]|jgi:outer membrane protein, adhesin transport system|uniref:TolC family outer membrane protein n=1 Tax=Bradyrhizobium TaxID=374 RepID=UPI00293E4EC7|nr:TolC family outer membrane protein [Bradyrhizobium sp. NDS-1]WOH72263.1 TolC family outer membrane protein [Bradyrhizobium sp. NDS-1]